MIASFTRLNPPLKINSVEVHLINPEAQFLKLVVHTPAYPQDLPTMQVQSWIGRQIHLAYRYLENEGFISFIKNGNWRNNATIVLHPPQKAL